MVIGKGVKEIGDRAFAANHSLSKITIPKNVTKIGEDAVWDGYYYYYIGGTKAYSVTIYCKKGSAAHKYAQKNSIPYMFY